MATFKDEQGNTVEAFTAQEVEAKLAEAKVGFEKESEQAITRLKEEHDKKVQESQGAVDSLKQEMEDLQSKLENINEKPEEHGGAQSENFKTLKSGFEKALKEKEEKINSLVDGLDKLSRARVNDQKDTLIKELSKNDAELKKKIDFHYSDTLKSMPENTIDEINARITAAYKLSYDGDRGPSALDIALGGGAGKSTFVAQGGQVEFSDGEKQIGNKLGITEEDRQKYGPRLTTKGGN
jgi:chromosome segregation ATPase